jgi:cation:H+ antiporter
MIDAALFVAGLVLLVGGAELLVSGAVRVARRVGLSALIIGLMIGFGTSTPELVTSVRGAIAGAPGIALGNIVGANVTNVLLVLGACALVRPLKVDARTLRFDGAIAAGSVVLFAALSALVPLSRPLGALYVGLLAAYLGWSWRIERRRPREHTAPFERGEAAAGLMPAETRAAGDSRSLVLAASQIVGGVVMVVLGARWLVDAAVALARALSVSQSVIGLTVVAIGTTLPELATSLAAARRGDTDVSLGNVLGSCIYNVLGIAGLTALVAPTVVPETIALVGNPIMVAAMLLMFVVARTGYRISRREGTVMLVLYAAYVGATWQA